MRINCIAVDDEPLALEIIQEYAEKIPYLDLKASFNNALEALQYLKTNSIDLIFLDIQMPDLTGIQFVDIMQNRPHIVFITAYENYAVKSYELEAIDYLLKPYEFERFLQATEKVFDKMNASKTDAPAAETKEELTYFFVKTEYKMQKVVVDEILYIEGMKNYIKIFTKDEKILTLQSFKKTEETLPGRKFVRVHKSYIVALDKIDSIERNRIIIGDTRIPIGETYKDYFYKMLDGNRLG